MLKVIWATTYREYHNYIMSLNDTLSKSLTWEIEQRILNGKFEGKNERGRALSSS